MSDETWPAPSRRALREARRAEAEALLAQEEAADTGAEAATAPKQPAAELPTVAKPVDKPAAKPVSKQAPAPAPGAKPVPKQAPAANPAAPARTAKPEPKVAPTAVAPARSRRATDGEVDAVPERAERTSLQRARDREALRTRRKLEQEVSELSPKTVSPGDDPAPLTRKQMRLQALKAASAANPGAAAEETSPAATAPASPRPAASTPGGPKKPAAKPAAAKPAPAKSPAAKTPAAKPAAKAPAAGEAKPAAKPEMSVEAALALRRRSGGGAPNEPLLIAPEEDLADVDLEVLAQQRELAARAAIISRRAAERLRMQEANTQRADARRSDPFTGAMNNLLDDEVEKKLVNTGITGPLTRGYNLAMTEQGTIVDGADPAAAPAAKTPASAPPAPKPQAPAAKAPAAKPAHKPKAATPAQAPAGGTKPPAAKQAAAAAPTKAAAPGPASAEAGTTGTTSAHPPVRAVRAQGLEPLDVQTAGMRRANNMYLMVIAALSVGGAALVAGLIMFLNSN